MEIERDLREDGTWLVLPSRKVPAAMAWGLAGMGLVGTVFMVFWMGGAAGWKLRGDGPAAFEIMRIVFAGLGLPGLLATLGMTAIGIGLACGASRCEIGIAHEELLVRERLGRLRWTWRIAAAALRGIVVSERGGGGIGGTLLVRRSGAKDLVAAPGYPAEVLHATATALGHELEKVAAAPVPVVDAPGLGPPPGTIEAEEAGGRIAIALTPPAKPWPLLGFGLAWLGFTGFMSWKAATGAGGPQWGALAFLLVFWAIGAGILLAFVHAGWRRISLLWADDRLTLIDRSPLRRRIRGWSRDELADILVVERGSGSGRYEAVAIRPREGKDLDLPNLGDRSAQAWIAGRLRLALRHTEPTAPEAIAIVDPAEPPPPGPEAALPPGSPVVIAAAGDGIEIELPPRGLGKGSGGMFPFGLVFAGFAAVIIAVILATAKTANDRLIPAAFCGVFFAVGAGMAWHGLRQGTRRTRIAAGPRGLAVEMRDRLGGRTWARTRAEIAEIRVEDSGTRMNDKVFWRLAIVASDGQRFTCGNEAEKPELDVIAARLRAALGPATAPAPPPPDPPPASR